MKVCTKCNIRLEDDPNNNFCPKCGEPVTVNENMAAGDYAVKVGDKNVLSGDIIGKKENVNVAGNATFLKTEDDTKRMVECSVTGKRVPYVESIVCPKCKKDVSKGGYNEILRRCLKCEEYAHSRYAAEVEKALADGKIDLTERVKLNKLARELSVDTTTTLKIESDVKMSIKTSLGKTELSPYLKLEFDLAIRYLFYQHDLEKANQQLQKLFKKKGENNDVSCLYYLTSALCDPENYIKKFEQRNVDTFWQHFWAFYPYFILQKDDEANELIENNKNLFPNQAGEVAVSEIAFFILCSKNLTENQYLEEAKKYYGRLEYSSSNRFIRQFVQTIGVILDPEKIHGEVSSQDDDAMVKFFETHFFSIEKKHPDGDYQGEWKGSKRHGQGAMTWQDGSRYEGRWEDDCRHGQGMMRYAGGEVYEGEWANDQKHGKGLMTWQDGSRYEGRWEDDCRHGQGMMRYAGGEVYEGEWANDQKHGKGLMTWQDGGKYEGLWENDCRHGQGTMHFENGDVYSGSWEKGEMHGKGSMTDREKNIYAGEWKNGIKQGAGKMDFCDGNIYEGQWKDNMFHGAGTLTWALDGTVYKGEFSNGKRHGNGIIHYADGDEYEGEWKNDAMHGKGRYIYADGQVIEGEWEDGELIDKDIPFDEVADEET